MGDYADQIKLISGLAVACFVLNEYWEKQSEDRLRRSLDYITVAVGKDIMASRVATELFAARQPMSDITVREVLWKDVNCGNVPPSACKPNQDAESRIYSLIETNGNEDIRTHIHNLLNIYYDVATCAIADGVCDRKTLCTAFYAEVSAFYWKYHGYLWSFDSKWNIGKVDRLGEFLDICEKPISGKRG